MDLLKEYKSSLKNLEAEEPLDIYFYRPIAFVIVKMFYGFPITPNQYSLLALISGLISSFFFSRGTSLGFKWGAFFFLGFAVLDCCDGMVARMKKNGTEFGRLIDGIVDYTVNVFVYFGLAFGVSKTITVMPIEPWILIVVAGVSKALHSITYDHYLSEYLAYDKGAVGFTHNELDELKLKLAKAQKEKSSLRIFALKLYVTYTTIQAGNSKKILNFNPREYCQKNLKMLRRWSFIGPSTHMLFLILAFLFDFHRAFFFYAIVFGNVWMILMFLFQFKINSSLKVEKVLS